MPLKNGEVFAGFVIQRLLGAGGMGEVYLVQHPRLPRLDALKVLPPALTANAEYRYRFNREAELASTLWHSNIVGIHDRGEFNGQLWISMDYVDGTDADRLVEESYPTGMPMLEALEIVTAVADALDVAHQRGLLHRDVKPANVMLAKAQGARRRILLADFGIARQADEVSGFTGTNMTIGSVGYAAPEQLMGEPIDGRTDQYGLAATAFHFLTGTMPFRDSNPAVVISKQLTTPAPVLSERRPDLANLDRVLSVALAKDPNQRYPHCLDFAEAFSRASRRPYTRGSAGPADATRPMSTEALNLPPTGSGARSAAATPTAAATRPMSVPSTSGPPRAPAHPTRRVGVPPPAAGVPEPPDATTRTGMPPRATTGPPKLPADATRGISLPALAPAAPDTTEALKLSTPAAAAPEPPADATDLLSVAPPTDQAPEAPVGDAQDSGGAAVAQMVSADHDTEPRSAQGVAADVHEAQSSTPPGAPAERRGNLLADPRWADALSVFFAERWGEAVERFETLQASYPGEGRVETRLKEARRQRDIDVWSSKAEASAAEGGWDIVLTALENLTAPQRRKALVDEMTALHQAGRWNAVVAAARELARIDPDNSDPGGIVSDAQAKIREAELADRYAQALNHLDQEQWQQAAGLLAAIEQEQLGYRDAAALLETAQQKLRETAEVTQRATPPPWPLPQTTTPAPPRTATPPDFVAVQRRWQTSSWFVAAVSIVALVGGLITLAVVQISKSSNTSTSTSTSTSTATTSAPSAFGQASGPNETIGDYIKKNNIQETTITHGTPGAPKIDLPVPVGWTRIPEGADAPYGGIVFNTPTDPKDPPKIIAIVAKLTGYVDTDKLLAVAPGEVKNLPGYNGGDGQKSTLSGHPAYQVAGSYTKNGVTRMVAQKTVVIQSKDGVYVLQLKAEGPQADANALNDVTGVIDQKTTITP
ncbi:MAG TPA: LpqN/LpqT family lipoprotein [Mycobacterium sp.]|nr:LpqN/LpqT family lipoprotein [Mycobacterium sp.]